jgi:Restriction endonuclease
MIMEDLEKLTGLQFEKVIYDIFIRLGFRTLLTKVSGDGGVDLIAEYDGLLFKGKYLIQCKHWKAKVGEPALRDFYGTIISNHALKGILITTSSFTQQAINFSRDKNIELIDGKALKELINSSFYTKSTETNQIILTKDNIGFLYNSNFDKDTYLLVKDRIEKDMNVEFPHLSMIRLLMDSIFTQGKAAGDNGLIDECIHRLNTYIDIFGKGRTILARAKNICFSYQRAFLYFLKGDFSKSYEILKPYEEGMDINIQFFYHIRTPWNSLLYAVKKIIGVQGTEKVIEIFKDEVESDLKRREFDKIIIRDNYNFNGLEQEKDRLSRLFKDVNLNNLNKLKIATTLLDVEYQNVDLEKLILCYIREFKYNGIFSMDYKTYSFGNLIKKFEIDTENNLDIHQAILRSYGEELYTSLSN